MLRTKGSRRLWKPACPSCKSTETKGSKARGPWERMQHLISVKFYRCRRCNTRFSQMQIVWDRRTVFVLVAVVVLSAASATGAFFFSRSRYVSASAWIQGAIRQMMVYMPKDTERGDLIKTEGSSERAGETSSD